MNVKLTPELEALVRQKVESGDYTSHSEVVSEALKLLIERDFANEQSLSTWRSALARGLEEADAGELHDGPRAIQKARQALESRRVG